MRITERIETEIAYKCDVLVCGGGFAGISAALAAAMTNDFSQLDVSQLQKRLVDSQVVLHLDVCK